MEKELPERILVCGGRDFLSYLLVDLVLKNYKHSIKVLIQGGAKGADFLAKAWAFDNKVPCEEYSADWKQYGKAAGMLRNKQMLEEGKPDLVIALPGGRGTDNMVKLALEAGVKVEDLRNG